MTTAALASAHQQFEAALPAIRQIRPLRPPPPATRPRRSPRRGHRLCLEGLARPGGSRPESRRRRRDRDRRLGRPPRPQGAADRQSQRRSRRHGHLPPPRPGALLLPGRLLRFRTGHPVRIRTRDLERNGWSRTGASARPTRRASGWISRPGSRACPHGGGGRPSCWPRATGPSRSPGRVGITPAAVSQARSWLARSWREFQGETAAACDHGPRPSCPRPRGHSDVRVRP